MRKKEKQQHHTVSYNNNDEEKEPIRSHSTAPFSDERQRKKKKNTEKNRITRKRQRYEQKDAEFVSFVRCANVLVSCSVVDRTGIVLDFFAWYFFSASSQILNHLIDVYFNINIVPVIFNQIFRLSRSHAFNATATLGTIIRLAFRNAREWYKNQKCKMKSI